MADATGGSVIFGESQNILLFSAVVPLFFSLSNLFDERKDTLSSRPCVYQLVVPVTQQHDVCVTTPPKTTGTANNMLYQTVILAILNRFGHLFPNCKL